MSAPTETDRADGLREAARAASRGDARAVRRVLEGVGPAVLRMVRGALGRSNPDVEDVVQESLLAVARALPAFRGECGVVHYACRIAIRTARAARRAATEARGRAEDASSREPQLARAAPPDEDALASRRRDLLRGLLADLPEEQAESMALRIVLGCSLQEVALATGAPVNTVRSRLRLAKEALHRRIGEDPRLAETLEVAG